MTELIDKSEATKEIWWLYNNYVNNASNFEPEETEAVNRSFSRLQNIIDGMPTTTEEEIRAKAIDEFVEMLRPIMAEFRKNKNPHAFIDINRIAEQLKWKSTYSKYVQEELEEER